MTWARHGDASTAVIQFDCIISRDGNSNNCLSRALHAQRLLLEWRRTKWPRRIVRRHGACIVSSGACIRARTFQNSRGSAQKLLGLLNRMAWSRKLLIGYQLPNPTLNRPSFPCGILRTEHSSLIRLVICSSMHWGTPCAPKITQVENRKHCPRGMVRRVAAPRRVHAKCIAQRRRARLTSSKPRMLFAHLLIRSREYTGVATRNTSAC